MINYNITIAVDQVKTDKEQVVKRTVSVISIEEYNTILTALNNQYDIENEYKSSRGAQCPKIMELIKKLKRGIE